MRMGYIIAGLIIAAIGIAAVLGKFEYAKKEEILDVGGLNATFTHDKTVPQWAGILGIVVGGGLVLVGVFKKS